MNTLKTSILTVLILGLPHIALPAQDAPPRALVLPNQTTINLGTHVSYLEDESDELTFESASDNYRQGRFTRSNMDTPTFGFTTSVYWFAVELSSNQPEISNWYLQIAYPPLDLVEVQVYSDGKFANHYKTGDRLKFSERPVENRNYLFPVSVTPSAPSFLIIRVQQLEGDVVEVPMALISQESFAASEMPALLMDGAYAGIMVVMALYNLLLFFYLRQRAYLYYVGFVAVNAIFFTALQGWAKFIIWPSYIILNQLIFPITIALGGLLFSQFSASLLSIKKTPLLTVRCLQLMICIALLSVSFLPYWLAYGLGLLSLFTTIVIFCIGCGALEWRKGNQAAKYYCTGFAVFFVGTIALFLNKQGIIPRNAFTEYSVRIGSIIEVCLFSLALASKIKTLENENSAIQLKENASQAALLETYKALGDELAQREKLEKQNENLERGILLASEQLIQADKLSTLGSLTAGVAHDITSPTQFIVSGVETSNQCIEAIDKRLKSLLGEDNEEAREVYRAFSADISNTESALSDIGLGAKRITAINEAIRNQARSDTAPETFLLKPLIQECTTILGSKLTFSQTIIDCNESLAVFARRSHIGQVITNLVSNAADALSEHTTEHGPVIEIKGELRVEGICLSVSDNGPGIPEDMREKILEPFFTTKAVGKGTGLGMPICVRIAEAHGSKLEISPSPSLGGAQFSLILSTAQSGGEEA